MSQFSNVVFGSLAAVATFGAIQLASGSDLRGMRADAGQLSAVDTSVNRGAKSDRAATVGAASGGQTVSFRSDTVAGTSVLLRLPAPARSDAVSPSSAPISVQPRAGRRSTIACESMVSVLTEVAKHLEPGRCVT